MAGIVILNWNGWRDTIEAVSSTRGLTGAAFRVYVIDNASTDGSESHLRAWDPMLTILQSGDNLGWSGGNNVGIRAALADGCRHVLLLNNDAILRPDALTALVDAAESLPDAACVGSLIVDVREPGWVEFGGTYVEARTDMPRQIHGRVSDLNLPRAPHRTVAVKGCSMMLTANGLARVGLLTEDYFLNYDETDWCYRANAAGLANYLVATSVVEHKGAVSFGGTDGPLYRYFITRNRLVFARRHLGGKGQWHAWRSAFWDFRQALFARLPDATGHRLKKRWLLATSVLLAVCDFCRGRLGDCPPAVRSRNQRYRTAWSHPTIGRRDGA